MRNFPWNISRLVPGKALKGLSSFFGSGFSLNGHLQTGSASQGGRTAHALKVPRLLRGFPLFVSTLHACVTRRHSHLCHEWLRGAKRFISYRGPNANTHLPHFDPDHMPPPICHHVDRNLHPAAFILNLKRLNQPSDVRSVILNPVKKKKTFK